MNLEIKKLNTNDSEYFYALVQIFAEVFEWENFQPPTKKYLQRLLENPNFLVFICLKEGVPVAGLSVYVIQRYDSENPSAYIYDLAVLEELQRKGIGKLLIKNLLEYCSENGFKEVYVQADISDIEAVNFYRKTPITNELTANHFTYELK
jgi:aminoglycoside 3-N-acetyltransferase I